MKIYKFIKENVLRESVILILIFVNILFLISLIENPITPSILVSDIEDHHTSQSFIIRNNTVIVKDVECKMLIGKSMQPTFFEGNELCFKPIEINTLKKGDIVEYTKGIHNVTHRIVSVNLLNKTIITRGDNSPKEAKETINFSQLKGKLVLTIYS